MEGIIAIVSIIWGVLSIILFFKIWKMTEDVSRLTQLVEKFTESQKGNESSNMVERKQTHSVEIENSDGELSINGIKKNDIVKLLKRGTLYKVIGFTDEGNIACERLHQNILEKAFNYFSIFAPSDLEKVEE